MITNGAGVISCPAHLAATRRQGADLRGVVNIGRRQRQSDNLPRAGIDTDMEFAPGSARLGAVLLNQPLPGSAEFQPRAVDQQVPWASTPRTDWHGQSAGAAAQGGMVAALALMGSGTGRLSWSNCISEPISPSVWRKAMWKSARSVSAVSIATAE